MTGILIQYAALPIKLVEQRPQVLMVTSRETRRWILPRGRPEKNIKAAEVAAQEAFEEAGVVGQISTKTIGGFDSTKRLRTGVEAPTRVRVYLLMVEQELDDWPERSQRDRQWLPLDQAIDLASEPGLADFLRSFAALWSTQ